MKIKFIGTGSGITSLKRFHSSLLFSEPKYKLLIDAGDGISKALLTQKISFNSINGIVISHLHPDHFSGLSSLIVQMKISGRRNDLNIFIHNNLVKLIKIYLYQSYIFNERLGFKLNYVGFEHEERIKLTTELSFISKQNSHLDHYKAFDKGNTLSFSCSSFLFQYRDKDIFYSGDMGGKNDLYLFGDTKPKVLITEISHIDISDILTILRSFEKGKIILTHISDEDEIKLERLFNSLNKKELKRITTAYDGLTISI